MNYEERIKRRIIAYIVYTLIGVGMITVGILVDRPMLLTLGAAFAVMGIVRIVLYAHLIKNPTALESREIAVTDERNLLISQKAKSLTFSWFVFFSGIASIVCFAINEILIGQTVAFSLCGAVFLYRIFYLYYQKRN